MKLSRAIAGLILLSVAGTIGFWAWTNRDYYFKVAKPTPRKMTAAEFIENGPGNINTVYLTDLELGEPVVIDRGNTKHLEVWVPVYLPKQAKDKPSPKIILQTTSSLASKAEVAIFKKRTEVDGIVMNGLPGGELQVPPEVEQAFPKFDASTVWYLKKDGVDKVQTTRTAVFVASTMALFGMFVFTSAFFFRPEPGVAKESRRRPRLRPLDPTTQDLAKRSYYHPKCHGTTVVSGEDFVRLECPFRGVSGTFCCGCQQHVPLNEVQWSDTNEVIGRYRERIAGVVSFWERIKLSLFANAYQGAINLGVDEYGHIVQPLREPQESNKLVANAFSKALAPTETNA